MVILALKQLCVHPMLVLKGAYKDNLNDTIPDEENIDHNNSELS